MEFHRQRLQDLHALYHRHSTTIDSLQAALSREVPPLAKTLDLSFEAITAMEDFIADKMTLFRFLCKHKFSLPHALSFVLDTLQWRLKEDLHTIHTQSFSPSLLYPFCFFYAEDSLGRPVLVIRMQHLPQSPTNMTEFLRPFLLYVLEAIRHRTWQMAQQGSFVDMCVVVDFQQARSLPMDPTLLQSILAVLRHFPSMTGSVSLLHFGWMYTGVWQMIKVMLSEEAKNRVGFPKRRDLVSLVGEEVTALVMEEGSDRETSLLHNKDTFHTYYPCAADMDINNAAESLLHSRCSSTGSLSTVYYDALEKMALNSRSNSSSHLSLQWTANSTRTRPHARSPHLAPLTALSTYETPVGSLTPRHPRNPLPPKSDMAFYFALSQRLTTLQSMATTRLSSRRQHPQQQHPQQPEGPSDSLRSRRVLQWMYYCDRAQRALKRSLLRTLRKTHPYKTTLYWIAACLLLRNSVNEVIQNLFVLLLESLVDIRSHRPSLVWKALLGWTGGRVHQMTL